jgi:TolB-like protein|tara:strand:+ start:275 stop:1165 length:891 start_codon:yes stop_codon:yes gene_type:complete
MIKRITSLLLFVGICFSQATIIAVFDFENNGLETHQVRQITSRLESELVKIEGLKVVERNKIDELLKEQKLQMSGFVEEEYLIDVGKMLGAKQVVLGSIGRITDDYYTITAKLVDVKSSEMIQSADYDAENGLIQLLKDGLKIIASQLVIENPATATFKTMNNLKTTLDSKKYIIAINKIYLDGDAFKSKAGDFFGMPVRIYLFQDGEKIWEVALGRGKGLIKVGKTKIIKFNPLTSYELLITEDVFISKETVGVDSTGFKAYWIKSKDGDWPFVKNKISFGNNSYIELSQMAYDD